MGAIPDEQAMGVVKVLSNMAPQIIETGPAIVVLAQALLHLDQQMTEHRHYFEALPTSSAVLETPPSTAGQPITESPTTDDRSDAAEQEFTAQMILRLLLWALPDMASGRVGLDSKFAAKWDAWSASEKTAVLDAAHGRLTSLRQAIESSAVSPQAAESPSSGSADYVRVTGTVFQCGPGWTFRRLPEYRMGVEFVRIEPASVGPEGRFAEEEQG